MNKLIARLPIILIGLSLLVFSGCILPVSDPPKEWAVVKFLNSSNEDIKIKMINHPISYNGSDIIINIDSMEEEGSNEYVFGEKNAIDSYFSILGSDDKIRIELHVGNSLVEEWTPPSGSFGSSINSPFNYDSWKFEAIEPTGNNVVGKITFTITDEDLK